MAGTSAQQQDALGQILELVLLLGDDMDRRLTSEGLSPARTKVIWTLQQAGPSTQASIADAIGVTPRNVTGLVDGLVQSGFVTRSPHPEDRRATLVALTPHAQRVVDDLRTEEVSFARQLFGAMPETTFSGLVDGLGSVLDVVRTELAAQENSQP